jgi:hypothetical protein
VRDVAEQRGDGCIEHGFHRQVHDLEEQ